MPSRTFKLMALVLGVAILLLLGYRWYSSNTISVRDLATGDNPAPLVPLNEILSGGPPRDGIPPIDDPKFVGAEEAEEFVDEDTLGLLVSESGETKFYPYNIMVWHEIVNDEVGGKPLSVTFCPLCATGIAFEREIDGTVFDFGTSGKLYDSNLVMYDRQTDSLWSQVLGTAIVGPLTGTELVVHPATVTSFAKARAAHADMKVLSNETGHVRNYRRNPYQGYEENDDVYFPVSRRDRRLHGKTLVYVVPIDEGFRAYQWEELLEERNFTDEAFGRKLEVSLGDDDMVLIRDADTGERLIGFHSFWFSVATLGVENMTLWER